MGGLPNGTRITIGGLYFLFYAAQGSMLPFLGVHLNRQGFPGGAVGLLLALPAMASLISAPPLAGLADSTHTRGQVLRLAVAGAMLSSLVIPLVGTFTGVALALFAYALVVAPVAPLLDNYAVSTLADEAKRYGRLRLWGTLGWGCAAPITGVLIDGLGTGAIFYSCSLLMLGCLILCLRLPVPGEQGAPQPWHHMGFFVRDRDWLSLMGIAFVGGVGLAATHSFVPIYLDLLGASAFAVGVAVALATASEAVGLLASSRLLRSWGARTLLVFSGIVYVVRLGAYSITGSPVLIMAVQLLHGPSYGTMWAAAVDRADRIAPPGLGATAQALLAATYLGLGLAVGSLGGGYLYQTLGVRPTFGWMGVVVMIGTAACTLGDWKPPSRRVLN